MVGKRIRDWYGGRRIWFLGWLLRHLTREELEFVEALAALGLSPRRGGR